MPQPNSTYGLEGSSRLKSGVGFPSGSTGEMMSIFSCLNDPYKTLAVPSKRHFSFLITGIQFVINPWK